MPNFNDRRVDLPEFVPGPDSPRDRGLLPQPHERRERKNSHKHLPRRRDMMALNKVMVPRVEALCSLSHMLLTDDAASIMCAYSRPHNKPTAHALRLAVPPPTPEVGEIGR